MKIERIFFFWDKSAEKFILRTYPFSAASFYKYIITRLGQGVESMLTMLGIAISRATPPLVSGSMNYGIIHVMFSAMLAPPL